MMIYFITYEDNIYFFNVEDYILFCCTMEVVFTSMVAHTKTKKTFPVEDAIYFSGENYIMMYILPWDIKNIYFPGRNIYISVGDNKYLFTWKIYTFFGGR